MVLSKEELATMGFNTQVELMKHLVMTQPEGDILMPLLENPNIFDNITLTEFDKTISGEYDTRRALFLMLCGAWVDNLQGMVNILINSESSSGKSYLAKAVTKILPPDMLTYRTKITPEAFTYWHNAKFEPTWSWDGKVLYLEDVKEAILNSDTLKVMCSEGSIATIVKNQMAIDIIIQGKPIVVMTTASYAPNNEILNRFNLLTMNETEEQTSHIIHKQSLIAQGEKDVYDENIIKALGKLTRIKVNIPFSDKIGKIFPKDLVRHRRDYPKFLDLIKCSVALHQFQRKQDENGCFVAEERDYELAREVINKIRDSGGDFGLSYSLKKAYGYCLELLKELPDGFSANEIFLKYPYKAKRNWYETLEKLSERGLLVVREERRETSDRPITIYKIKQEKLQLELPTYKNLIVNDVNDVNDVNNGNDVNDGKKAIDGGIVHPHNHTSIGSFTSFTNKKGGYFDLLPKIECKLCGLKVFEDDFNKKEGRCCFCSNQQKVTKESVK